jgi:hypothetical protein
MMMRAWTILALTACSLGLTGCGVMYVPVQQRFPEPVRAIRVVDDETGRTIAGAHVDYEVLRHAGWSHEQPALKEAPTAAAETQGAASAGDLKVLRYRDGAFVVEDSSKTAWVQNYFPLKGGEGYDYYHDYTARIRATAPGHEPLVVEYAAERPPLAGWSETAGGGRTEFDVNGVLWFYLRSRAVSGKSNE